MDIKDTVLVVIDVQGNLATAMYGHEQLFLNIERSIAIARIFDLPIVWTEQAPDKIGPTVEPISKLLFPVVKPISKRSFSCYANADFKAHIDGLGRKQALIVGIETHVCVFQTARDLHRHGYKVFVVGDAVSSRTQANKEIAIDRMRHEGIVITSLEMAACELMQSADHPRFKDVMAQYKR